MFSKKLNVSHRLETRQNDETAWGLLLSAIWLAALVTLTGCQGDGDSESSGDDAVTSIKKNVSVKILIIESDENLGSESSLTEIKSLLASKWQSPGESFVASGIELGDDNKLEIHTTTESEFLAGDQSLAGQVDCIIYPPRMLGTLVDKNLIAPGDYSSLSPKLQPNDFLGHQRTNLVEFGGRNWGVSLGSPTFVLVYR